MSTGPARRTLSTAAPAATILIRLMVGGVFLSEGIQKFLYPAALGVGRFTKIGIPCPEVTGPFVGWVEIICGVLILIGLATRWASVVLLINISVAIVATKVPILLGHGYWTFTLKVLPRYGFWSMMHEARTDCSLWLGLAFLLIVGAGTLSVDAALAGRSHGAAPNVDKARLGMTSR